jgi:hypothetical protein
MGDPLELGRVTDRRPPFKYSAVSETRRPTRVPEELRAVVREFEGIDLVE